MSDRLPLELWYSIFRIVNTDRNFLGARFDTQRSRWVHEISHWDEWPTRHVWNLSHVCRHWRHAVIGDPGLWTQFLIRMVPSPRQNFAADTWKRELELAGRQSLTLDIVFSEDSFWMFDQLAIFFQYQAQWERVSISATNRGISHLISNIRYMPRLKCLHFGWSYDVSPRSRFPPMMLPNSTFPGLVDFELGVVSRSASTTMELPLAQLKRFKYRGQFEDLSFMRSLQELRNAEDVTLIHYFASRSDNLIGPNTNLMHDPRYYGIEWQQLSDSWSNICTLHLYTDDEVIHEFVIQKMDLPKLTDLTLVGLSGYTVLHLPSFLERCNNGLDQLTIQASWLTNARVEQLLPCLPRVRYLNVACHEDSMEPFDANDLLSALIVREGQHILCPKLERLDIQLANFTGSNLLSMLQSRLRSDAVHIKMSWVNMRHSRIIGSGDKEHREFARGFAQFRQEYPSCEVMIRERCLR